MVRIRGTIGAWPVDLTIEMDAADWQHLGAQLNVQADAPATVAPAAKPASQDDALWQTTLKLVQQAGQVSGPELLGQLEGLTGSTAAGKRLLVRLRHCREVRVESGADAPLYCWVE
ncbi:hypothetical protein [Pseudomonas sp.]|uniref:hypothetical protein n=1 Tax=Pseudomonas sp. TaxID=306 RepID=UPI003CC67FFA